MCSYCGLRCYLLVPYVLVCPFKSSQPVSRCFSVSLLPYTSLKCKLRASTALVCELWVQSQLDTHCNPYRPQDLHHHVMVILYHAQVRTKSCTCKACRMFTCVHHFLCACWVCSRWVSVTDVVTLGCLIPNQRPKGIRASTSFSDTMARPHHQTLLVCTLGRVPGWL